MKIFSNFLAHKLYEWAFEQLEISHILFLSRRGISINVDSGPLLYVVLSVTTKTGVSFAYWKGQTEKQEFAKLYDFSEVLNLISARFLKFIYSEKATQFCKISSLFLTVCTAGKSKVKILQNFVAFYEYTNFTNWPNHSA